MNIGIVDDMFFALQSKLVNEGNDLHVYGGFSKRLVPTSFDVCNHTRGTINQHVEHFSLIEEGCSFFICGTNTHNDVSGFDYFKNLDLPVIGHSQSVVLLESDRNYAKLVNDTLGISDLILTPDTKSFTDKQELIDFLDDSEEDWVLKQAAGSPQHIAENRTWVSLAKNHISTISLLNAPNAWFNADGTGGVILEHFVQGQEVCFGAWFDGEKFLNPLYSCIEHKGAQNGDRGNMLTGEVGTTMSLNMLRADTLMGIVFSKLEPFLKGKCNGMIDINTILTNQGELYFVEYTVRWGRPTLEVQLSMLKPEVNYTDVMRQLAEGTHYDDILVDAYRMTEYATGVTVFSYGIPFIKQADATTASPTALKLAFEMPETDGIRNMTQQIFATFSQEQELWYTASSDRQFVVVGLGDTEEASMKAAYSPLVDYSLPTCTWRDDVGHSFFPTNLALRHWGIV